MKRFIIASILVSMVAALPMAQETRYAREVLCRLASPEMYGRGYDHHGDSIAAEYLRQQMRAMNLKPLADDYLQHYTIDICYIANDCSLKVGKKTLRPYYDYRLMPLWRLKEETFEKAKWKLLKDNVLYLGTDKLSEAVPLVPYGDYEEQYYVEILKPKGKATPDKIVSDIQVVRERNYRTQNVMGYIPGESDTMLVFTAHYDHLGTMGSGVCFHGAHDNASGVALTLDIARRYASRNNHYTLAFMLFSGEESGLCGSSFAAENPPIELAKVKLLVNLDMFCGSEGFAVVNATDSLTLPHVMQLLKTNDTLIHFPLVTLRDNARNSDHYPFTSLCPAIFLYTLGPGYGGYHSPLDDCHSCDLENGYEKYLTLISSLIR